MKLGLYKEQLDKEVYKYHVDKMYFDNEMEK